ncbi:hypothetical protein CQW23_00641 [Capsicum baccatum]|uniref:Ubiquitin-like protease family profile domain-containing protein n=1 Tax=Capsicum baccatum TaxID=33114 RepID=A0A2G2XLA2_CAPBA|nr:hypothetical protein CQW23_00641 [Capsicum baccatum]
MASLRQEFFVEKQLYRLGGIPEVLNVWMFELCSNVDTKVAVKEGPTSTDSPVKETDKPVEMKEDKVNQAPSPFKNGEQHEKDDGIEKLSDIVVEDMQSLNSIISVREHDMTLTIYKPPPTTPDKNCGVFVAVYAEYLSEELGILFSDIDAQYHCLRYASLLCKYGSEKAENDYFSENDNPLRPWSKFAPKETDRVLHIQ